MIAKALMFWAVIGALCLIEGQLGALSQQTPTLQAIMLAYQKEDRSECVEISRYQHGPTQLDQQVRQFLGCEISGELQRNLIAALYNYYRKTPCPFVSVTIPDQEITDGTLCIEIYQARLGAIALRGNCNATDRQLLNRLRMNPGGSINLCTLGADLAWINNTAFRRTTAIFRPGACPGTTDLQLCTNECRPWRLYYGWDNRGNSAIGHQRQFGGVQATNLICLNDLFTFQATFSADPKYLQGFGGNYEFPLPWRHIVSGYLGYAQVRTKKFSNYFRNLGENYDVSGRYRIPFCLNTSSWHEVFVGIDYKRTNNDVLFDDQEPIIGPKVSLMQELVGGRWDYFGRRLNSRLQANLYFSPAQFLRYQTEKTYGELRAGAKPRYVYFRGDWDLCWCLPYHCSFRIACGGQWASQRLLPSEEFILGGADSVRGYPEKQLLADNGLTLRCDFKHLWNFQLASNKGCLSLIGFLDYGLGVQNDQKKIFSLAPRCQSLLGIGPAIEFSYGCFVRARLDFGFPQLKLSNMGSKSGQLHFTACASY